MKLFNLLRYEIQESHPSIFPHLPHITSRSCPLVNFQPYHLTNQSLLSVSDLSTIFNRDHSDMVKVYQRFAISPVILVERCQHCRNRRNAESECG